MFQRILFCSLFTLCGLGLLAGWMPQSIAWRTFEMGVYFLLIVWSCGWLFRRTPDARWHWLLLPWIAIAGWGAVQLSFNWTDYHYATVVDELRWGVCASIFMLAFQTSGGYGDAHRFRRTFAVYGGIVAIVSVVQFFSGNGKIFWLFTPAEPAGLGPFLNRDHFASFAALALPVAAWEMRHRRNRWLFGLAAGTLYAAVIAGASRAGFALVTIEVILLFALLGFSARVAFGGVALIVGLVIVVGWEPLYDRLLQDPDPYSRRREVVSSPLQMIHAHPWKGIGLGNWTLVYPAYARRDFGVFVNAAHNDWLQWAAEGGLPFAGLLVCVFVGSVLIVRRAPWAMGVPIVFLHSLVDFPMQGRFFPAVVFLVLGVAGRSSLRSLS